MVCIWSQINEAYILQSYIFKIHLNIYNPIDTQVFKVTLSLLINQYKIDTYVFLRFSMCAIWPTHLFDLITMFLSQV